MLRPRALFQETTGIKSASFLYIVDPWEESWEGGLESVIKVLHFSEPKLEHSKWEFSVTNENDIVKLKWDQF